MKKIVTVLLFLNALLIAFNAPSVFAQQLPFKDSQTTIVGKGDSGIEPNPGTRPPGFVFYCQYGGVNSNGNLNDRWSWNVPPQYLPPDNIAPTCNIEHQGCGPTSIAMILSSYGSTYTPTEIATQRNIGCTDGTATHHITDMDSWLDARGFRLGPAMFDYGSHKLNLADIENFFSKNAGKGYYILGGASVRINTSSGLTSDSNHPHLFVITGVDPATGDLSAMDPTFCEGGNIGGARKIKEPNNFTLTTPGPTVGCNPDTNYCGWFIAFPITPK